MTDKQRTELDEALAAMQQRGLPVQPATADALEASMDRYAGQVALDIRQAVLDKLRTGIESIVNPQAELRPGKEHPVQVGESPATVRADVTKLLRDSGSPQDLIESLNLDFKIRIATEVAHGAGRFLLGQTDVEEYPGWELFRMYPRRVPRLWRGDEGTVDKSLGSAFASRWYEAAQIVHDVDAARMLHTTGRMIALKSSPIWQALGDFADGLHNPYPPFAFNSGMETRGVSRAECIRLGLLGKEDTPHPTNFNLTNLFSFSA